MTGLRLPLAVSVGGHAAAVGLLVVLAKAVPPPLALPLQKSFEIALTQPAPQLETVQPVQPPLEQAPASTPEPVAAVPPPPAPAVAIPDAPPADAPAVPTVAVVEPPPPPRPAPKPIAKPVVKPPPKPAPRPHEPTIASLPLPLPLPSPVARATPVYVPPPIYAPPVAVAPSPTPGPDLLAGYRSALGGWFESHKRYPESARARSEQGSAVVHFRVDRSGRVLDFAVLRSTGYADLDGGITDMLRGAQLPPFPAGATQSEIEVSVTLHFSLTH